jgi:hypothetical protein
MLLFIRIQEKFRQHINTVLIGFYIIILVISISQQLDLGWEIQQPATIRGWGQPFSKAFYCCLAVMRKFYVSSSQESAVAKEKTLNSWQHLSAQRCTM